MLSDSWQIASRLTGSCRRRRRDGGGGGVGRMRGRLCMSHGRIAGRRRRPRVVRRTQRVERIVEHVRVTGWIALLQTAAA